MRSQSILIPRECEYCGSSFAVHPYRIRNGTGHFCSHSCRRLAYVQYRPLHERFEAWVQRIEPCWLWTGPRTGSGYGCINKEQRYGSPHLRAHRVAWELRSGKPIPPRFVILHICDVPLCVRNDDEGTYEVGGVTLPRFGHLALGTQADNMRDRVAKQRRAR